MELQHTVDTNLVIAKANKFFLFVLWGLFLFSLGLALWHDTWTIAFAVGLPTALIPSLLIVKKPEAFLTRAVVATAMMAFCGLNIQQSSGMVEIHFGIFVLIAMLVVYQDWRVIVVAAGTIAVHHFLFNYLQATGHAVMCMHHADVRVIFVHAAYVIAETGAISYLAIVMKAMTKQAAEQQSSLKAQAESMRSVAATVHAGINTITEASQLLAASSQTIASGAQTQASSLEETAASLEQITAAIRQSAEFAHSASELAYASGKSAEEGGQIVSDAAIAMREINAASEKVTYFVSTINEIAFQTNLLSLNAAVEAARAGDEGRGFAVVASEVRELAHRTSEAAKEIKTLIENSITRTQRGVALVTRSGETLGQIVQSVKRVGAMVNDIAVGASEQKMGIEQVNTAMAEMDKVTQANTTQTDQLASAAHSLSTQSANLVELIQGLSA